MFLFFHSQQNDQNISYYKGKLFEQLLGRYLEASGYAIKIRVKRNSLEYDLEGTHRVDGRKVIGEAKAYEKNISGEIITSFIGKLAPYWLQNNSISGIFLSTSVLTPEAEDYLKTIDNLNIKVHSGNNLLSQISETLSLPKTSSLAQIIQPRGYYPLSSHLLTTDHGIFIVQLAASSTSAAPSSFALFREDGRMLSDEAYLRLLNEKVVELQPLSPIFDQSNAAVSERILNRGLAVGTDWSDYRLPAAPAIFVGRRELASEIERQVVASAEPNILQIKSRSGVGKSSLLAYLDSKFQEFGHKVELHDARDVKSVFDIFSLVQRFTSSKLPASDMKGVEQQLRVFAEKSKNQPAVFMVDQFESTFLSHDIFNAYENISLIFLNLKPNLYMIFTRKSDQLTTYDDNQVSLERINSLSKNYVLQDFTVKEAAELIDNINSSAPKPVSKEVRSYVLEFAQGFPWLIKRTMAHIVHLANLGASQNELFTAGLRLDELFDEELEGLDELEKDYLTKIAFRLPASIQQLQREFDEDPLLPKILDKLTRNRLLRLSGSTYDTYNDVFKEYLIYNKLPQFRQAFIYRIVPATVMKLFHKIVRQKKFTIEELEVNYTLPTGSAYNLIRELRALGLLKREAGYWLVPRNVLDIYDRGNLGEYVRRQLMGNGVVADLVSIVGKSGSFNINDLPEYLEQRFIFVNASKRTWGRYAIILRTWIEKTLLLSIDNNVFILPQDRRSDILDELGNLNHLTIRGTSKQNSIFFPSVQWRVVEETIEILIRNTGNLSNQHKKAVADLRSLELITDDGIKLETKEEIIQKITGVLLQQPYTRIWSLVSTDRSLLPIMKELLGDNLVDSTLKWRIKVLLNWGRELKIIHDTKHHRRQFFDAEQLKLLDTDE